jgi:hypothetical protein
MKLASAEAKNAATLATYVFRVSTRIRKWIKTNKQNRHLSLKTIPADDGLHKTASAEA